MPAPTPECFAFSPSPVPGGGRNERGRRLGGEKMGERGKVSWRGENGREGEVGRRGEGQERKVGRSGEGDERRRSPRGGSGVKTGM